MTDTFPLAEAPDPGDAADLALAFAHPEARAAATAGPDPRDRLSLRDHIVEADIGAYQPERGQRQRLRFNTVLELRPPAGPLADDVDRILSYDRITEAIAAELGAERLNLLETLAERLAARLLAEPQAMRAFIRIEKLDVGPYALGVEIVRSRGAQGDAGADMVPRPRVVHLDNAALAAPDLAARIDAWQAAGAPLILTVGLPDLPRPVTGHGPTQRRIDLLAMEQNAWALAARDARCIVTATRAEIDWALRRGRTVVWAPGKLVLDAVDGPQARDPLSLSRWLADSFGACEHVIHAGDPAPAGSRRADGRG